MILLFFLTTHIKFSYCIKELSYISPYIASVVLGVIRDVCKFFMDLN